MKSIFLHYISSSLLLLFSLSLVAQVNKEAYQKFIIEHPFNNRTRLTPEDIKKIPKKDRPDLAWEQEFLMTLDPAIGYPPRERLIPIIKQMQNQQNSFKKLPGGATSPWEERGPSNVGGRTRALMFDPNAASGNKVWAGGATGGLWYTNDITDVNATWNSVDDFWDNIAITCIAYDPNNTQIFYVGTGEGWGAGSSRGAGIWKTTDGGVTWNQLSSSSDFYYVNDIAVRNETGTSVVYAAVDGRYYSGTWHGLSNFGLHRSTNGGTSWSQVLPNISGKPYSPADISIAADNRIWIGSKKNPYGNGGGKILYSDNGTSWTVGYTHSNGGRVAIATAPSDANYIYALIEANYKLDAVVNTTNKGASWSAKNEPDATATGMSSDDFTRGQAWYDLVIAVDPNNKNTIYAGGIDLFKSTNGGSSWNQLSYWHPYYGTPEVHADQHAIVCRSGSSSDVLFGNDGGVFYSSNANAGSPSFTNRNLNYNFTQFYACAMHPSSGTDYYLAGSQDNGSQQFNNSGMNSTVEVTGGDGAFCFIDQDNPTYQITSYVYNSYRRSVNSGASFSSIQDDQTTGKFINPCDYDNTQNILYSSRTDNTIQRINNITGSISIDNFTVSGMVDMATHIRVSEYTTSSSTIYVGTGAGDIYKVTNANTGAPVSVQISNGIPAGNISCIEIGADENELLATISNFGLTSVWHTTNGGASWTGKEGNLPDMPVRWALFNPNNRNEVILATDLGVWGCTDFNNASPDWQASNSGLSNVRVDMLQIRTSDFQVSAATHGRGLFTSNAFQQAPNTNDASISQITYPGANVCDSTIQPKVILYNLGDSTLSNINIKYNIDGGPTQSFSWSGSLFTGQKDTVSLNSISFNSGTHELKAYGDQPNGQTDEDASNDTSTLSFNFKSGLTYPLIEDFEAGINPPTDWSINDPGGAKTWELTSSVPGADGNSTKAFTVNNFSYNNLGAYDDLVTHYIKAGGATSNPKLIFDVSYARYSDSYSDALLIEVSNDCGQNYQQLYFKTGKDALGNQLSTTSNHSSSFIPANATEWRSDTVDVSAFKNQNIIIKFSNINGYGNNLYLDNIKLEDESSCLVQNTMNKTDASCSASNGTITANPGSGTSPYTYLWSTTETSSTIQNLSTGTYLVTITDDVGCVFIDSAEIAQSVFNISDSTITDPVCNGGSDGSISVTLSGGTPNYTYSWSNSTSSSSLNSLSAGTYSLTVTDQNNCTATSSFIITDPGLILSNANADSVSCFGIYDGTISLSPSNGTVPYTYNWSNGELTSNIAFLDTGNYIVTITDSNSCETTDTISIYQPDSISLSVNVINDTCLSGTGSISTNVSGGTGSYSYIWNNGSTSSSLSSVLAGTYSVSVSDHNLCQSSKQVNIDTIGLADYYISKTDNSCFSGSTGQAKAHITSGVGPYQYSWSNAINTDSISQLVSGTYILSITDSFGCVSIDSISINDGLEWTIQYDSIEANCNQNNGAAIITQVLNASQPLSYLWDDGQQTDTAFNLYAGIYGVTITDSASCKDSINVIVNNTVPDVNTASITQPVCSGDSNGMLIIDISGGTLPYQITWNTGSNSDSLINAAAGIYTVTVTDNDSCIRIYEDTLEEPDPLNGTANTVQPKCLNSADGTINLTSVNGTAPFTYLWFNSTTDSMLSNLSAGTYAYTVTDSNNCRWIDSAILTAPDSLLSNSTITDANCGQSDGQIILSVIGGSSPYTYLWSNASTDSINANLGAGSYIVSITDNNNCTDSITYFISNLNGPTLTFNKTDITCNSYNNGQATANVSGGNSPYQYSWSNGDSVQTITGLGKGTYFLSIEDQSGCITIDSVNIDEPDLIDIDITTTLASCNTADGTADANVSGGTFPYSYAWSNGSSSQSIFSLFAGGYDVSITDQNSCTASKTFNIINYLPNLNPSIISITCYGADNGKITVNATGGVSPYSYEWNNGDSLATIQNLSPGYYDVTITDASGCLTVYGDSLYEPDSIQIAFTATDILCNGDTNGTLSSSITGGTSPYTYSWSGGSTQNNISNLSAGTYSLSITDLNTCQSSSSHLISEPDPLQVIINTLDDHCQLDLGSINTSVFGGSTPYYYNWSSGQTSSSIDSLASGSYILILSDANNCMHYDTASIDTGTLMILNLSTTASDCDQPNGTITTSLSAGTPPYQYLWSTNAVTSSLSNISSGTYLLTITDSNSCTKTDSAIVNSNFNYNKAFGTDTIICIGDTLSLSVSDIDSFQWQPTTYINQTSDTSLIIEADSNISYEITLFSGTCEAEDSLHIIVNSLPVIEISVSTDTVESGESLTLTATGGTNYSWEPQSQITDPNTAIATVSPTQQSTYFLSVTDNNGCIATDSITIFIKDLLDLIKGVTGFSPNGDGKNDLWVINDISSYSNASVSIYNRHGNLIFKTTDYQNNWDGTKNGVAVNEGVYFYVIDFNDGSNFKTGYITLLR